MSFFCYLAFRQIVSPSRKGAKRKLKQTVQRLAAQNRRGVEEAFVEAEQAGVGETRLKT